MSTIAYRPEIDGLRCIAVVGAVGWHAQFNILGFDPVQGGFMGIEIFFVISGYLITLIVLREMQEQRFTLRGFYERRARRILPMLLTLLLTCLPLAWLFMQPKAVEEFAGSALAMLGFGSNFWFWLESSYWSEAAEFKPLLHTWTLSLEEQFYVLFPLLLIVLWRIGARSIIPVFLLIFVTSLTWMQHSVASDPDAAFYLLLPRMWELIGGGILAALEMKRGRTSPPWLEATMPWVGLVLVCAPNFLYHRDLAWPSYLTLVPVAGTMMVLWYTKPQHIVATLLSWKPIAGIGLISYSFYLWHFPVFAFARIKGPWPSQWEMVLYILFTIVLSVVTYNFIEKPFRSRRVMPLRIFVPIILSATLVVLVVSAYAYVNNGLWGRYTDKQLDMVGLSSDEASHDESGLPLVSGVKARCAYGEATLEELESCSFGDITSNKVFLLWGDSHSWTFLPLLDHIAKRKGWRGLWAMELGCPPLFDVRRADRKGIQAGCTGKLGRNLRTYLESGDVDLVILISRWLIFEQSAYKRGKSQIDDVIYLADEERESKDSETNALILYQGISNTLEELVVEKKISTTVLIAVPDLPVPIGMMNENTPLIKRAKYEELRKATVDIFKEYESFDRVNILDPIDAFCPGVFCQGLDDTVPLYQRDNNHPSRAGTLKLQPLFEDVFDKANN